MRNHSKILSLCIVLAMLMTLICIPSVSAESKVLLEEDFEGATNKFGSDCINETFEGMNAGKLPKETAPTVTADFEDVTSGGLKLSFDYYAKGASGSNVNTEIIINPAESDTAGVDTEVLQVFQGRIRYATGDEANIYNGDNGWRHIEQVFGIGTGTVKTYVYSIDGKELLAEGTEAISYSSIGGITFKEISKNMDFYMDNVKVETCELPAPEGVLAEEDFEGETNKFGTDCTVEEFEGHKAGRVGKNVTVTMDFDDVYSGGVKISLDAYAQSATGANVNSVIKAVAGGESATTCDLVQVFQHRVRYVTGDKANIYAGDNGWIHLEQILNLADGVAKTYIYSMDGKLLAEGSETVGCKSIGGLSINSMGSKDFYMDNVKVETCDPDEKPDTPPEGGDDEPVVPGRPSTFLSENFDGESSAMSANCSNVEFEGVEGKVGAVTYNPTGSGQYMSSVEFADIEGGGAKVSYDLYLINGQSHYIKAFPVSGKEYPLLQISGLGIGLTNGGASFYTAKGKCWVHVEQIMKLETGLVETSIYSMDGEFLGKSSNNVGYNSITSITFCNWSAAAKMNLYIDNLKVENYDVPPEVTVASFTKTDYSGNVVEDNNGVTPGIAKIDINFGTKMDGETLGGIKLKKKDGAEIKTTGSLDDMVYTLTLNEGLEPNSRYKVTVPAEVASSIGVKLGSSFTYEFGTGKGETAVSVAGLSKGDNKVTAISQLAEGDELTVSIGCGNLTEKELPVICVVTYYSGKAMKGIEAYALSAPKGYGVLTQNIKMPALSGVDKIKVVALNDLYGMLAYNEPTVIE